LNTLEIDTGTLLHEHWSFYWLPDILEHRFKMEAEHYQFWVTFYVTILYLVAFCQLQWISVGTVKCLHAAVMLCNYYSEELMILSVTNHLVLCRVCYIYNLLNLFNFLFLVFSIVTKIFWFCINVQSMNFEWKWACLL